MSERGCLLYCHCAFAKVVPAAVKERALTALGASGRDFEAVPDLCEMSARKDPELARLAAGAQTTIIACYPRAVRWLFEAGGAPLPEGARVLNMRDEDPDAWIAGLGEAADCVDTQRSAAPAPSTSGEASR